MVSQTDPVDPLHLAFVCVENTGRSQIAAVIAETHVQIQSRTGIELLCEGTDPAEESYLTVVKVMREKGCDLSTCTPERITRKELEKCDVALLSCSLSIDNFPPGTVVHNLGFIDPADTAVESVGTLSTEIEHRVIELIDDLPSEKDRRKLKIQ